MALADEQWRPTAATVVLMSSEDASKFGTQFSATRFEKGQQRGLFVKSCLYKIFNAKNVVDVESDTPFDNYADNKEIHQVLDYTGIDYLIDPFDSPLFGVNHRNHLQSHHTLFDIRSDTGTASPSELSKLQSNDGWDIVPRYATRMKIVDGSSFEWFRTVDLKQFIDCFDRSVLDPVKEWQDGQKDVTALMFDYSELASCDILIDDITND